MTIQEYINNVNQRYQLGNSTEHTFRGDLQHLIEHVIPAVRVTNEPKRQKCGAPDYTLTRRSIEVGYIEAKNIGEKDLYGKKKTGNKEQFDRYRNALDNLIFTDYLTFLFYRNGELITEVSIGELTDNGIIPLAENFLKFENLISDFSNEVSQTIENPQKLAEMMAGKARLLSDIIEKSLLNDDKTEEDSTLKQQMLAFKDVLIHDITPKSFADVYSQTIAYGMFAARLHDPSLESFSRQEAAELIPKSNPFLRKLFGYIAGPDIDERILWIVDDLVKIFLACNVSEVLKNYGKKTRTEDPIIHFYETFLAEYDPKLRKARGVWYTPAPVVNFIVRAVDEILKSEFELPMGLADTSKTIISVDAGSDTKSGKARLKKQEVHKVQVLDPATGTGTFLAECIKHIHKEFKGQAGIWSSYVENELLPRLNGFEILMASYAMAHLKLDLLLSETGYIATKQQRTKVYLTNSLEEAHPDTGTLFASWLSTEANEANHVKKDTPVMCIIGNPPYSGESANKGDWIMDLMKDYKKEPGGQVRLQERNSKWINDDYVKFLRYGQNFIEKNGTGVLAFINPHGFLDNPTFRGMRWHLLKTYDTIYTVDLHGNSNKKEACPDGSPDTNVFDIKQGVAITLFVKTGKKPTNKLAKVYHYDLYGKRDEKYQFLAGNSISSIPFKLLPNKAPNYYMVQMDYEAEAKYRMGFSLDDLFVTNSVGVVTAKDKVLIAQSQNLLKQQIESCYDAYDDKLVEDISYRPFDTRKIYYDLNKVTRGRENVMKHLINGENIGLVSVSKQPLNIPTSYYFVSSSMIINGYIRSDSVSIDSILPLYLYHEASLEGGISRTPNLDEGIVHKISNKLKLTFTPEKEEASGAFAPIDLLDYIYAVLHSPNYRKQYKAFLKISFAKIPYPKNTVDFWKLVQLGGEIRELHLLESPRVDNYITSYPVSGSNIISRKLTKSDIGYEPITKTHGKVWINDEQYFDKVPLIAWEFYIGGYQPAQKWLKDRKDSTLEFSDILHYQKIIVALSETQRLMQEIEALTFKY